MEDFAGRPSGPRGGAGAQALAVAVLGLALSAGAIVWAFRTRCATPPAGPELGGVAARLDINSADAPTLEALPGVGPALARRIVEDRRLRGPFGRPEDLLRVRGVTRELLDRLTPFLEARPLAEDADAGRR